MKIERECIVCGKSFIANRPQIITCSYECSKIRFREKQAEYKRKNKLENQNKKEKQTPTKKLVDDAVNARKLGKSYGQYKAMEYMNMRGGK